MSAFDFQIEVKTTASDEEVQRVKKLADKRCPALWAMDNKVPYTNVRPESINHGGKGTFRRLLRLFK